MIGAETTCGTPTPAGLILRFSHEEPRTDRNNDTDCKTTLSALVIPFLRNSSVLHLGVILFTVGGSMQPLLKCFYRVLVLES